MKTLSVGLLLVPLFGWADDSVVFKNNVEYRQVDGETLKLDIAKSANDSKPRPIIVVFHGGAWRAGTKDMMRIFVEQYVRAGFVSATVQYRFCPKYKFPACVDDSKASIRWIREHAAEFGGDPNRIGVMGMSAGGHLALMLGFTDDQSEFDKRLEPSSTSTRVQAVCNYFGPVDMTLRDWNPKDEHLLVDFLGGTLDQIPEVYKRASPANYIDPKDPPVISFHGTKDPLVPYGQAVLLHELLVQKKVESKLQPVVGAGHAWLGKPLQTTQKDSIDFFREQLLK